MARKKRKVIRVRKNPAGKGFQVTLNGRLVRFGRVSNFGTIKRAREVASALRAFEKKR